MDKGINYTEGGVHNKVRQLEEDIREFKLENTINADTEIPEFVIDQMVNLIASSWQRFGRLLGLSESSIDGIDLDEPNIFERCRACITKYKQIHGGIAFSWLKEILIRMERTDVINVLELNYDKLVQSNKIIFRNERVEAACHQLKEYYKKRFGEILRSNGIFDISKDKLDRCSSYVDLAVAPTHQVEKSWSIYSDKDFLFNQSATLDFSIKPEDFFADKDNFLCLSGVAGSGKSTLLLFLTMQWAKNEFWKSETNGGFQFVFTILCRELNRSSCTSLEALIKNQYPFIFEHISFADLQTFADKILIIIDGLDEYAYLKNLINGDEMCDSFKTCAGVYGALNSWDSSLLGHCVIASGRPEAAKLTYNCFKATLKIKCVEVLGFNADNVELFIRKYFEGKSYLTCTMVKEKIFQSVYLKAMAKLPVYLSILCLLLEAESDAQITTVSEVFAWSLGLYIRAHYHGAHVNIANVPLKKLFMVREIQKSLNYVFEIAYRMLREGKVLFNVDQLNAHCGDSLEYCGLISTVEVDEFTTMLQFTHLCLQEYCAAAYIFQQRIDYVSVKENPLLRSCLSFISSFEGAALQKSHSHPVMKSFVASLDVKEGFSTSVVSMLGADIFNVESEVVELDTNNVSVDLFLTSLFEYQNGLTNDLKSLLQKKKVSIEINKYTQVHLSTTYYFVDMILKQFKNVLQIKFFGTLSKLSNDFFVKFSKFFLDIERVCIKQNTELSDDCFEIMMRIFEEKILAKDEIKLKCLELNACGAMKDTHLKAIARILPYIEEFNVSYNASLTTEGFYYVKKSLENVQNCSLKTLNLACCNLDEISIETLKFTITSVRNLDLSYNSRISLCGWICFANAFQMDHTKLQCLHLTQCSITDDIMDALYYVFIKLKNIHLGLNRNITTNGWNTLSKALIKNEIITTLDLYACNLDDECFEILAPAFIKVTYLVLRWNRKITSRGWKYIVRVLRACPSQVNLKKIDAKGCNITIDDLVVLDKLISHLEEVSVSFNPVLWKDIFLLDNVASDIKEQNPWF